MLKTIVLLNIFVETFIFFRIVWRIKRAGIIWNIIFYNNLIVITAASNQFNA